MINQNVRFNNLPKNVIAVLSGLSQKSFQATLVGGCVRDLLLNQDPKDYDVATDAIPEEVLNVFPGSKLVGASFGVVLVGDIEVATFREDVGGLDGRHPEYITYSKSMFVDATRRDFTINAIFYDMERGLVDLVGGLNDLNNKVLKFVGHPTDRVNEDYLRMLRAVRFAVKYGLTLHPDTERAIKENAPKLNLLSKERVLAELERMLMHESRARAILLMKDLGILKVVLPEVSQMVGLQQPLEFHPEGDVFQHTVLALGYLPNCVSRELAFATLLHDVGKFATFEFTDRARFNGHDAIGAEIATSILKRLKASNELIDKVAVMVANHMRFRFAQEMRKSKLVRMMCRNTFADEMELHRADCLASSGKLDNWNFLLNFMYESKDMPSEKKIKAIINGGHLIKMGVKPGPVFRTLLLQVQDAVLEGTVQNTEEAIALVQTLMS